MFWVWYKLVCLVLAAFMPGFQCGDHFPAGFGVQLLGVVATFLPGFGAVATFLRVFLDMLLMDGQKEGCVSQQNAKPELPPKELTQRRSDNAQVAKTCKKLVDKLEPLLKTCAKATKSKMAKESFKSQVNGAKTVLKAAKTVQGPG